MTLADVPRYDPDRAREIGETAVVIGGSVAGLLAARVLSDWFGEVTIVERDPLPDESTPRRGVPQGRHIHALMKAGRATIEDLFPGYGEELLSAGGVQIDMASDVLHYEKGDFVADGPTRLPTYYATRPLFERIVRRRIRDRTGVALLDEHQFLDYTTDDAGTTVTGVHVRTDDGDTQEIAADLVVDATGRTSRTPNWLAENGYTAPQVDDVTVDLAYSSVLSERPPDDRRALIVAPAPSRLRGVGVFPVENDRWLITYFGMHGDHPPTDPGNVREFSANLPGPDPLELLDAEPTFSEGIDHYPFASNRRRRYEDLERFPAGLVVIGDAIASFNPIYGQGMSVAALEALLLHHTLAGETNPSIARSFFGRTEDVIDVAWSMAAGADFQYPPTTGPKPRGTEFFTWYVGRLTRKAHSDGELRETFYRVINMEYPPSRLLRPRTLWRVLRPF